MTFFKRKSELVSAAEALPGRAHSMPVPAAHFVNGAPLRPPFAPGIVEAVFGTGHAEVVRVFFDPAVVSYAALLRAFWERHDPTQGMRQGNDLGTQYRSVIYCTSPEQLEQAQQSLVRYQAELQSRGFAGITTEVRAAPEFYYAEDYHQQYLAKNPAGYCGLGGTGVSCPL